MKTKTQNQTMKSLYALALSCVLTVVGTVATHAQNLIANGDFMANAAVFIGNNGIVGFPNPSAITSWTAGAGNIGLNGPGTSAGSPYAPLNGDGGNTFAFIHWGSPGSTLSQTLSGAYTPSVQYELSFDAAGFRWAPSTAFQVSIADNSQTHFTTGVLDSTPLESFTHFSYMFTSPAVFDGPAVIQLVNLQPAGTAIDFANVSLVVPEPATVGLAGLGILLAGLIRRHR
jgi:hypothetical protein